MKVADLSGEELDYWVARAEGDEKPYIAEYGPTHPSRRMRGGMLCGGYTKQEVKAMHGMIPRLRRYSESWLLGGPIIERGLNAVERFRGDDMAWIASYGDPECQRSETGPTPLIAAMRAYVASKFGDEVPEEK